MTAADGGWLWSSDGTISPNLERRMLFRTVFIVLTTFLWALAPAWAASIAVLSSGDASGLIRDGGVALLLRHGQTEPGVGDPQGFTLLSCKSQRNLSDDGRLQVRAMATRAKKAGIRFARVYTSQWCRCRETAQLLAHAPSMVRDLPLLNSQFPGNPQIAESDALMRETLRSIQAGESWLFVTHQVNIAALTGISPASGEGVLVRMTATGLVVLGRVNL
jgi:phosphohistidine phosphatase SixA